MSQAYGVLTEKALNVYRQQRVETASPGELVFLLYSEAIRSMRESIAALNGKDFALSNQRLLKSQDIIDELKSALNLEAAPGFAGSLGSMYDFVFSRLLAANIRKDAVLVEEALQVTLELRGIWEEVLRQNGTRD